MAQIIIANSLTAGLVVYLTDDNSWSTDITDAAVAGDEQAANSLLQTAQSAETNDEVIDPYLIEVNVNGAGPQPVEYREFIRAFGPSIDLPAGKTES